MRLRKCIRSPFLWSFCAISTNRLFERSELSVCGYVKHRSFRELGLLIHWSRSMGLTPLCKSPSPCQNLPPLILYLCSPLHPHTFVFSNPPIKYKSGCQKEYYTYANQQQSIAYNIFSPHYVGRYQSYKTIRDNK